MCGAVPSSGHLWHIHEAVIKEWRSVWIDRFCSVRRCRGARVVEYGIGAGNLATYLFSAYAPEHYAGVDISERQRAATAAHLRHVASRVSLHAPGIEFASLRPDVFISQAVIQHFPSLGYADEFLANINRSGACRRPPHRCPPCSPGPNGVPIRSPSRPRRAA